MEFPNQDWKGWLPGEFSLSVEVRSNTFHADIRRAVKTIRNKCGGVPSAEETALMLEALAKEVRKKGNLSYDK